MATVPSTLVADDARDGLAPILEVDHDESEGQSDEFSELCPPSEFEAEDDDGAKSM
jgi:hypothetical protein